MRKRYLSLIENKELPFDVEELVSSALNEADNFSRFSLGHSSAWRTGSATSSDITSAAARARTQARTEPAFSSSRTGTATPSNIRAAQYRDSQKPENAPRAQRASADRYSAQARAAGKPPEKGSTNSGDAQTRYTSEKLRSQKSIEAKRQEKLGPKLSDSIPPTRGEIDRAGSAERANRLSQERRAKLATERGQRATTSSREAREERRRKENNISKSVYGSIRFNQQRGKDSQADQAAAQARRERENREAQRSRAETATQRGQRTTTSSRPAREAEQERRDNLPKGTAGAGEGDRDTTTGKSSTSSYTVKKGDNPTTIARSMGISLQQLYDANPGLKGNERRIQIGQTFKGPSSSSSSETTPSVPRRRPTRTSDSTPASKTTTTPPSNDSMTFGQAFASARKAGKSTFTWRGKSYTTRTK